MKDTVRKTVFLLLALLTASACGGAAPQTAENSPVPEAAAAPAEEPAKETPAPVTASSRERMISARTG